MTASCSNPDLAGLSQTHQEYMAAYARGDAAAVASFYTEDGQVYPAHTGVISNRAAIQAFWQGTMDLGIRSILMETLETELSGEQCTEIGRYSMSGGMSQVLDVGKYIGIWKIENKTWHLHRYIWTTSLPPPGPSPGTD
jgi:ketosteroid isomerase-like protein